MSLSKKCAITATRGQAAVHLPPELQRKGRKRAATARNALADDSPTLALAYWAVADWGARIDFDEKGGNMWAVIDDGAGGDG